MTGPYSAALIAAAVLAFVVGCTSGTQEAEKTRTVATETRPPSTETGPVGEQPTSVEPVTVTVRTVFTIERRDGTARRCVSDEDGQRCKTVRLKH